MHLLVDLLYSIIKGVFFYLPFAIVSWTAIAIAIFYRVKKVSSFTSREYVLCIPVYFRLYLLHMEFFLIILMDTPPSLGEIGL